MRGLRRLGPAALAAALLLPAPYAHAEPGAWSATSDTGQLGDDIARFVGASPSLNMVNQGFDTVFVTGTSTKPRALAGSGVDDLDVGTTAYNAETGALRWQAIYDRGPGIHDQIGAFEVNFHNNLIYEIVNSGNDIVTIERAVRDGDLDSSAVISGATARDSAISSTGGFLGVVGWQGGKLLVATYMTGIPTLIMQTSPIDGKANSADISHSGSLDTTRTMLVTGQSSAFGSGGDLYTVAYDYQAARDPQLPPQKLWERSWASPGNRADEGMVAEAAHVTSLGKGVGFVAGRTFTVDRGWDIFVSAYNLQTGVPLWSGDGMRHFDGTSGRDDIPLHLAYSDKTSTLYLTGTSERGATHDQDVVTVAYDAATGTQKATSYASGDSSNADDTPTGLTVSKDGSRVFVAADVQNLIGSGGRQAALFVYDSMLRSAGTRIVGGSSVDRSAGVALNVAQTRAFLAGSTQTNTGYDHHVESFGIDSFALSPIAADLAFMPDSAAGGQYSDDATLQVKLVDDVGAPLGGRTVSFTLAGDEQSATTTPDGVASATFTLTSAPGTYTATANFAGEGRYSAAQASTPFEISREDSTLSFTAGSATTGQYTDRATLEVQLDDDVGAPLGDQRVVFQLGDATEAVRTDADGVACASLPLDVPGSYVASATFDGDTFYLADEATAPFEVTKEDTSMTLAASGNGSKRILTARLFDADTEASGVGDRTIVFYGDGIQIGTATTNGQGSAKLTVPPGYRGGVHAFRAVFSGDDSFFRSEAETRT